MLIWLLLKVSAKDIIHPPIQMEDITQTIIH